MQLVKNKATREPLSQAATRQLFDECLRRGFLTMAYAANFRIQPATTIDKATVQEIVDLLTEVFGAVANSGWR